MKKGMLFFLAICLALVLGCSGNGNGNGKANAAEPAPKTTVQAYDADGQYLGIFLGNEDVANNEGVANVVDNVDNNSNNAQQQFQIGGSPSATITIHATSSEPVAEIFIPALGYIVRIGQHTGDVFDRDLRFETLDCTGPRYSASANRIYRDYDERYFVGIEGPVEIEYPEQPDCDDGENQLNNLQKYPIASRLSLVDDELECTLVEKYAECPPPEQGQAYEPQQNPEDEVDNTNTSINDQSQMQIGGSPSARITTYVHMNPWYLTEEISMFLVLPVALPLRYIYE
jgi:hypothetical protein